MWQKLDNKIEQRILKTRGKSCCETLNAAYGRAQFSQFEFECAATCKRAELFFTWRTRDGCHVPAVSLHEFETVSSLGSTSAMLIVLGEAENACFFKTI